ALPELRKRMRELLAAPTTRFYALQRAGGMLFALKRQPPKEQPVLVTLASADDPASAHTLFDPTALDPSGQTAIHFFLACRDGKLGAVSPSKGGSEEGTLHVYDVSARAEWPDLIPRVLVATGGGDLVWDADGTGFFYTRYPHPGERPKDELDFFINIYHHR